MATMEGRRVVATATIVDLSGDDPSYGIEPGDEGTIRRLGPGTSNPGPEDHGVEWDKYPGIINLVDPEDVRVIGRR